jgi:DNA invertase Pin-like site-specific DNA recombinase
MKKKEQVVCYYRTSNNGRVGKEKDSLKRQKKVCIDFSSKQKYEVVGEFYDDGVKGKDSLMDRKGFRDLLSYCEGSGVRTILVENSSRFSRDIIVQETGFRMLSDRGFKLISCDSPSSFLDDDTPSVKLIRQILGCVSEFQKDEIVRRLIGSKQRIREENKQSGKSLTVNKQGKCEGRKSYIEIDEDLVRLVKRLRRKSPKFGTQMSYGKIQKELTSRGLLNNKGKEFNKGQIYRMVQM